MADGARSRRPTVAEKKKLNLRIPKEFLGKVYKWTSFYRKYPFAFVEDTMNIKLKLSQKIELYIMNHYNFTTILASRGNVSFATFHSNETKKFGKIGES